MTTPVAGSRVNVPWPAIVTTLSASQVVVFGMYKHVTPAPLVCKSVPVARPEPPVMFVKLIVPPGRTDLVCGVAAGGVGIETLNVIFAVVC